MKPSDCKPLFAELAPEGCYVAIRVGFYAPEVEMNLFSAEWIDHYTRIGGALSDPLLHWARDNSGHAHWHEISVPGKTSILADYERFGLSHGCVVSIPGSDEVPKRSVGIFARHDRNFSASELSKLEQALKNLHEDGAKPLTGPQLEALKLYSEGYLYKQIAHTLDISQGAVKLRLKNGADRLKARSVREAAHIAASRGLL
ncbi:LuxR family transcriptional regulator [Thioclava sp. ES.031]|uniref:helix-turn-helix transcriptional regulator n=1 Tax=Thioclava sp. ES.031 TaxID=1798203 RepID=UPI000BF94B12|nr:autoinducer binding domain-containing protein [Thioclava sp. ES.031]PFG62236.1 LuxR family transcriptional regulator [Thioclava sp. ES.031]